MALIQNIILLFIAVIIHEFGHFAGFIFFNKMPDIKIKWYGIFMGEKVFPLLTMKQIYAVCGLGILSGFLVLAFASYEILLIYLLMCCVDIVNMLIVMGTPKKLLNTQLIDVERINYQKMVSQTSQLKKSEVNIW